MNIGKCLRVLKMYFNFFISILILWKLEAILQGNRSFNFEWIGCSLSISREGLWLVWLHQRFPGLESFVLTLIYITAVIRKVSVVQSSEKSEYIDYHIPYEPEMLFENIIYLFLVIPLIFKTLIQIWTILWRVTAKNFWINCIWVIIFLESQKKWAKYWLLGPRCK